jgi:hypothetical protein
LKDFATAKEAIARRKAKEAAKQAVQAEQMEKQRRLYSWKRSLYSQYTYDYEAEMRYLIRREFREAYIGLGTRW